MNHRIYPFTSDVDAQLTLLFTGLMTVTLIIFIQLVLILIIMEIITLEIACNFA